MAEQDNVEVALSMDIILSDEPGVVARQLQEVTDADGSLVIGLHVNDEDAPAALHVTLVGYRAGNTPPDVVHVLKEIVDALESGTVVTEDQAATLEDAIAMMDAPFPDLPPRRPIVDAPEVP